jgi:hypothetical protein
MAVGRAERRAERHDRVAAAVGVNQAEAALDLLELVELAWHDCYGVVAPPDDVIDDILLVSGGSLEGMISAGRLAVIDRRDLRLAADELRGRG